MRNVFPNIDTLTQSGWFQALPDRLPPQKDQVLRSLRVEDETYRQLRQKSSVLEGIESAAAARLPVVKNLSRDVFQSFYALTLRHNEESKLSPKVRRFNRYILDKMMQQPDFPAVKADCEGKAFPSMEATEEFMRQIANHLDELLDAANGEKKTLDALEVQEQKQRQRLAQVRQLAKKGEGSPLTPAEEKKLLAQGNRLFQKDKQLERLGQMVRDHLLGNKEGNQIIV